MDGATAPPKAAAAVSAVAAPVRPRPRPRPRPKRPRPVASARPKVPKVHKVRKKARTNQAWNAQWNAMQQAAKTATFNRAVDKRKQKSIRAKKRKRAKSKAFEETLKQKQKTLQSMFVRQTPKDIDDKDQDLASFQLPAEAMPDRWIDPHTTHPPDKPLHTHILSVDYVDTVLPWGKRKKIWKRVDRDSESDADTALVDRIWAKHHGTTPGDIPAKRDDSSDDDDDDDDPRSRSSLKSKSATRWIDPVQDKAASAPVLRVYGVVPHGNKTVSCMIHVHNFRPYMYVKVQPALMKQTCPKFYTVYEMYTKTARIMHKKRQFNKAKALPVPPADHPELQLLAQRLTAALEKRLVKAVGQRTRHRPPFVVQCGVEMRASIRKFHFGCLSPFIKLTLCSPRVIRTCREVLSKRGVWLEYYDKVRKRTGIYHRFAEGDLFECDIPFETRFLVDAFLGGHAWFTMPPGSFSFRPPSEKTTQYDVEIDTSYTALISRTPDAPPSDDAWNHDMDWSLVPRLRILSFDIECKGRKGHFPRPDHDPVIQISYVLTYSDDPTKRTVLAFTIGGCTPIQDAHIYNFEDRNLRQAEKRLLACDARLRRLMQPHLVTGWNLDFDIPYLYERAAHLGEHTAIYWSPNYEATHVRTTLFKSRGTGERVQKNVRIPGQQVFDMMKVVRADAKLSSYTLNYVSGTYLGRQKDDVHHSRISTLFEGSDEDRAKLLRYCIKDSQLPLDIMFKKKKIVNYVEMCRVTGVQLQMLLDRGQGVKTESKLLPMSRKRNLLKPWSGERVEVDPEDEEEEQEVQGATVIAPKRGFYKKPVITLDFASLYPSIMMAHNLCYSTILTDPEEVTWLHPDDYVAGPGLGEDGNDVYFVKDYVQQGILPDLEKHLLASRKAVKNMMKTAPNEDLYMIWDGRQLALKITCNAVYGFTSGFKLKQSAITSMVTWFGRDLIDRTLEFCEKQYTVARGYPGNAQVIYGDTDSVMVYFRPVDRVYVWPATLPLPRQSVVLATRGAWRVVKVHYEVQSIEEACTLGEIMADECNDTLYKKPIFLEFEKVYWPYLLMNKKRYAAMKYEPGKKPKLDTKGLELVRRDNSALLRETIKHVFDGIFKKEDAGRAFRSPEEIDKIYDERIQTMIQYVQNDVVRPLLEGKTDISKLIITKGLSKSEYDDKVVHDEVAKKMRARDPGSAPQTGDRVSYVFVRHTKKAKAWERADDPNYVIENNLPIDYRLYFEKQLRKPLRRIFLHFLKDPDLEIPWDASDADLKRFLEKTAYPDIETKLFGNVAKENKLATTFTRNGMLGRMLLRYDPCMVPECTEQAVVGTALCTRCTHDSDGTRRAWLALQQETEWAQRNVWAIQQNCQTCVGSHHNPIDCANDECPQFYKRTTTRNEMNRLMRLNELF